MVIGHLGLEMILVVTLLILSVINDLKHYKIKNEINLIFILIGLCLHIPTNEHINALLTAAGIVAPFIVLFPLYALRMLGAGDIKLFCAIGSLTGLYDVILSIAYSFLFGFFIAVIIMVYRENFLTRFRKLYLYLKDCLITMNIQPYCNLQDTKDGTMHFSIPIALGTIAVNLLRLT